MDPARKRRTRLVVSLVAALLLATALMYTSFNASSEAKTPSQLIAVAEAEAGRSYQLTGKVVDGSIVKRGSVTTFEVRDRSGTAKVPVRYEGAIPDPFREGREIIITVRRQGSVYEGERDSLITKCPSKFSDEQKPGTSTTPADR
ncbi:MAG: cytochrome c maturation protein CcmE [Baekduia sp.]